MALAFRWLFRGFIGLSVLFFITLMLVYYFATRSLPDYNKNYEFHGLNGPVEVVRNTNNVPHIFAQNVEDVYFGLGFSHAQDRIWQMTMLRRTAQGRLSEIFGEETFEIDDFMRRLDLVNLSRASLDFQTEEVKDALQAYSAGVNAWLGVVKENALGRGAPEFFFFSPELEPWTPSDSLSILRVMAVQMSEHLRSEVVRAQVTLAVGPDRVGDILPDAPGKGSMALTELSSLLDKIPEKFSAVPPQHPLDPVKQLDMAGASNAWAAAGSRSATGQPILANDPHLGLSAPSAWMLARMDFPDGGIIGGTIPGIPAILSGRSETLAWGLTASYLDDLDIYVERVNPKNPNEYLTPDGYKPFIEKEVFIKVKDEAPRTIKLRWTENGPVIPGKHFDLQSITPNGHLTSIRWAALDINDQSMTAAINMMRAKSIPTANAAMAFHKAPSQNMILADRNGVMMQMIGKQPKRYTTHRSLGRFPSQGWINENRWDGYLPY